MEGLRNFCPSRKLRMSRAIHFAVQPNSGSRPISLDGCRRDLQNVRGLLDRETGEEPQFDNPGLLRIHAREFPERVVQREHIEIALLRKLDDVVKRNLAVVATFCSLSVAGVI